MFYNYSEINDCFYIKKIFVFDIKNLFLESKEEGEP